MDQKLMYSRTEAARMLGVSLRLIDRMIADGALAVKHIGRRVLIPLASLDRFSHAADPAPPKPLSTTSAGQQNPKFLEVPR